MWDYSQKVMDHFLNPRNVGEIENPDAVGEVGNITCGDALKLTLRVDRKDERIVEAKFQTFGCASAIASASALTELIRGKTLVEAARLSNQDIASYLGELPEEKMHCSVMGREALDAAIANYRGEKPPEAEAHPEGDIVCTCFGVTDKKIEQVVRQNNLTTVEQVTHYTKAGGGCGGCHDRIREIIEHTRAEMVREARERAGQGGERKRLTNLQRMKLVSEAIEREVRPALRHDGGDIELVDVEGTRIIVSMRGACSGCAAAGFTLKSLVEAKLREYVGEDVTVEVAE